MMAATIALPSPHTIEQKSRIKSPLIRRFPSPLRWLGAIRAIKPGRCFTGSGYHVTNRTKASGLITGVFTRCRPRTAHHQPTGITHMTLTNRDKRPPDTGAVKAHLRRAAENQRAKEVVIVASVTLPTIRPAPYTPAAESAAPRSDRADVSPGTHCHRRPPHNQR